MSQCKPLLTNKYSSHTFTLLLLLEETNSKPIEFTFNIQQNSRYHDF